MTNLNFLELLLAGRSNNTWLQNRNYNTEFSLSGGADISRPPFWKTVQFRVRHVSWCGFEPPWKPFFLWKRKKEGLMPRENKQKTGRHFNIQVAKFETWSSGSPEGAEIRTRKRHMCKGRLTSNRTIQFNIEVVKFESLSSPLVNLVKCFTDERVHRCHIVKSADAWVIGSVRSQRGNPRCDKSILFTT